MDIFLYCQIKPKNMLPFVQFSSRNIKKSAAYYLSFKLKGNIFAANFPKIYGFSRDYTFISLTGYSDNIPGLAEIDSEYIPILDLARKIGYSDSLVTGKERLMILEIELYASKVIFAIPYDQLGDAFEVYQKKVLETPNIGSIFESGYIEGIHIHNSEVIYILNFQKIINIDDLIDLKMASKKIELEQ
jgi:chemotaxis signal transduction protein